MYYDKYTILDEVISILKKYGLKDIIPHYDEYEYNIEIEYNKNQKYKRIKLIKEPSGITKNIYDESGYFPEQKHLNYFGKYFDRLSTHRKKDKGIFYHFIKYEFLHSILENKRIRLYSLSKQLEKDPLEYNEFKQLIFPQRIKLFDKRVVKNDVFIFCFTKDFRNPKFWDVYGKEEPESNKIENIAVAFRFKNFKEEYKYSSNYFLNPLIYRDVIYNTNNRFDFLRDIQITLMEKYENHYFEFDNIRLFAPFFKRGKFEWEDEVRLAFSYQDEITYNKFFGEKKFNDFVLNEEERYAEIGLVNDYFDLEISELICGKDIDNKRFEELKRLAPENIRVWKYIN